MRRLYEPMAYGPEPIEQSFWPTTVQGATDYAPVDGPQEAEVAIVGVNKMQVRPVWDGQQFRPRKMMNLSCSFDHRVVDGWDAAVFVQKLKSLLETPAMLFVEG